MHCDIVFNQVTILDAQGDEQHNQTVALADGRIMWSGPHSEAPLDMLRSAKECISGQGKLLTPGFIDCHTHLVYAGQRTAEFRLKLEGSSYAQIAQAGGGILSTVRQTRAASEEELIAQSLPRLLALQEDGVTTVEIKSGYGLELASELKMLRVARQLGLLTGMRVKTTFLGAHALSPEYQGNSQGYIDVLCAEMLPAIHESGLADAVDVFCESIAFSIPQCAQIFQVAKQLGLPIKCHAEQLSNIGASSLAAQFDALSCDHLEHLDAKGVAALAQAQTVAVLLPGAYYFLAEKKKPPIAELRRARVAMAIATDSNPGSSPTTSLRLMMSMACQFFNLSIAEVCAGVTTHAAQALGIANEVGIIAAGKVADLVLWSTEDSASLCYYFGSPLKHRTMIAGKWIESVSNGRG